ncbi:hypothetical protein AVEN_26769-1 [Araneus ventricosus]|uniref:SOCS box domain-containing protein n=1 Tax=Araneus ventricosus TaxID=182803 RepID=A0A4Y2D4Z1_ARAVE|nr:hypothetical protein AVEN_26769-1 [Araneus ventricosus]
MWAWCKLNVPSWVKRPSAGGMRKHVSLFNNSCLSCKNCILKFHFTTFVDMNKIIAKQDKTDEFLSLFSNLKKLKMEQLPDQIGIEEKIFYLLYFYERHKNWIDKRHSRRVIFNELPDFCFENHMENAVIVTEILRCINDLPSAGMPNMVLFISLKCLTNKTLPLKTIQQRNQLKKASFTALTYFLHYAYKQRLMFRNRKLMEMITYTNPFLFAKLLFFSNSRSLLSLIQFGLRFEFSERYSFRTPPIFLCAAEVLCWFIEMERFRNNADLQRRAHQAYFIDKLQLFCRNFKILLLSTSNPNKTKYEVAYALMKYGTLDEFGQLQPYFEQFFPDMDFQSNQPPSLQHTCRYVIRSRLDERWRLPYGVWNLPLPRKISSYLNFGVDEKGNETI